MNLGGGAIPLETRRWGREVSSRSSRSVLAVLAVLALGFAGCTSEQGIEDEAAPGNEGDNGLGAVPLEPTPRTVIVNPPARLEFANNWLGETYLELKAPASLVDYGWTRADASAAWTVMPWMFMARANPPVARPGDCSDFPATWMFLGGLSREYSNVEAVHGAGLYRVVVFSPQAAMLSVSFGEPGQSPDASPTRHNATIASAVERLEVETSLETQPSVVATAGVTVNATNTTSALITTFTVQGEGSFLNPNSLNATLRPVGESACAVRQNPLDRPADQATNDFHLPGNFALGQATPFEWNARFEAGAATSPDSIIVDSRAWRIPLR